MKIFIFSPSFGCGGCDYYAYAAETEDEARGYFLEQWFEHNLNSIAITRTGCLKYYEGRPNSMYPDLNRCLQERVDWMFTCNPECVIDLDGLKPGPIDHESFAYYE